MARTNIPVTELTANTSLADAAGTAIDATNSHVFTPTQPLNEYLIRVKNTTSSAKTATVKAGANPPADASGQGNLASVSLADGSTTPTIGWFGPLTSSRFVQADGTVQIDVAAAMTGAITVFHIPRNS